MSILQDLVLLHSEKPNKKHRFRLDYDGDRLQPFHLEVILIIVGAFTLLSVATVLSIPDKQRQEELKNVDMGREFVAEPCDIELTREAGVRSHSIAPTLHPCVY